MKMFDVYENGSFKRVILTVLTKKNQLLAYISVLYLLMTTTDLFFLTRAKIQTDTGNAPNNFLISIIGNTVFILILSNIFKYKEDLIYIVKKNYPVFIFVAYALGSCLWSPFPLIALRRWVKVTILLTIVINIVISENKYVFLRAIIIHYMSISIFLSLILLVLFPEFGWMKYGDGYLPKGIFNHKNSLATAMATGFFLLIWLYRRDYNSKYKFFQSLLCVLSFCLLIASQGKTALGGFCLAVTFLLLSKFFKRMKNAAMIQYALFFFLISIYSISFLTGYNIFDEILLYAINLAGKDITFTGRTVIWDILFNAGLEEHSVLGAGFDSFFLKHDQIRQVANWNASHAHNEYLQIFLNFGMIGIVIYLLNLFSIFRCFFCSGRNPETHLLASLMIFFLFRSFFEPIFMRDSWAYFVFLTLLFFLGDIYTESKSQKMIS